jgi:hypothetical protein
MRVAQIAVVAAMLAIPAAASAQDSGQVGGKVGSDLSAPQQARPGVAVAPYGGRPSVGPTAGYAGSVAPGQVLPQGSAVAQRPGGVGTAFVDGHRVLVDPNSNRILRVLH